MYKSYPRLLSAGLLACLPLLMFGFTIRGRIVESISSEPCSGAQFTVYHANDTVRGILSGSTGVDGDFEESIRGHGRYILRANYPGKKSRDVAFEAKSANDKVELGEILLDESGSVLEEVTVVAKKDLITSDGAKLTYDVERDPSSGTNTVMEMLRKVPMVTVDGEDNIRVKGATDFRIYINGKEDPMISGNPKEVLKSMPASSIKKIEVITDPGAKLDAEGAGGILNIITDRKQALEGYLATVRAGISNGGYNGSVYARTKINKVTASLSMNGWNSHIFRTHNRSESEREDFESDDNRYYRTRQRSLTKYDSEALNYNMSWEPDTLNLFTLSASIYHNFFKSKTAQTIDMRNIDRELQWQYKRDFLTRQHNSNLSIDASYQHTFPHQNGHTLTLSYQYNYSDSPFRSIVDNYDYITFPGTPEPYQERTRSSYSNSHTAQADYVLPLFGDKHSFEAGAKLTMRPQRMGDAIYMGDSPEAADLYSRIRLSQHNNVYAGYVSYTATFGKFTGRAGVRYEHTDLGMDYHLLENTGSYTDFTTRLNDIVPNAALTYRITPMSNLRLSYSMRITRPSLGNLNPYENVLTYGDLSYGNPNLTSAHSNSIDLKYSNYGGKLSGEATVGYRQTNDLITNYSFMKDNVLHSTFANIGKYSGLHMSTYLMYQITDNMDASVWISLNYSDYKAGKGMTAHNHGWNSNMNANYGWTMPCKLRLDAWGGYWSPYHSLQYNGAWGYYYGLSLSRSFLKQDALTVSVNASDLFPVWQTQNSTSKTETTLTRSSSRYSRWSAGLSVSFRFGSLKSDVKRTKVRISNDDVNESKESK